MSGDLDGNDAFDKLLEVALDSRVDVRRALDERDNARSAQRDAELLMTEQKIKIRQLEQNEAKSTPLLQELWEAAEALRELVGPGGINEAQVVNGDNLVVIRLRAALDASKDYCGQPPF